MRLPTADTLPVDRYRRLPFLVNVDPDNHPHGNGIFMIGVFQHTCLPEGSAQVG